MIWTTLPLTFISPSSDHPNNLFIVTGIGKDLVREPNPASTS